MLRRAETDPSAAVDQLTRDIARIRSDLDSMRSAVSHSGREWVDDARDRLGDTTGRAYKTTRRFVRGHPGATTGIGVGLLAIITGVLFSVLMFRR